MTISLLPEIPFTKLGAGSQIDARAMVCPAIASQFQALVWPAPVQGAVSAQTAQSLLSGSATPKPASDETETANRHEAETFVANTEMPTLAAPSPPPAMPSRHEAEAESVPLPPPNKAASTIEVPPPFTGQPPLAANEADPHPTPQQKGRDSAQEPAQGLASAPIAPPPAPLRPVVPPMTKAQTHPAQGATPASPAVPAVNPPTQDSVPEQKNAPSKTASGAPSTQPLSGILVPTIEATPANNGTFEKRPAETLAEHATPPAQHPAFGLKAQTEPNSFVSPQHSLRDIKEAPTREGPKSIPAATAPPNDFALTGTSSVETAPPPKTPMGYETEHPGQPAPHHRAAEPQEETGSADQPRDVPPKRNLAESTLHVVPAESPQSDGKMPLPEEASKRASEFPEAIARQGQQAVERPIQNPSAGTTEPRVFDPLWPPPTSTEMPARDPAAEAELSQPFAVHNIASPGASPEPSAHANAIARPATAHAIAEQISVAVAQATDGQIEVSLAPEELGRVKLSIQHGENGLNVVLQAERPETLDLMRRNIELLQRDFRALGYEQINFSFNQNGAGQGSGFHEGARPDQSDGTPAAHAPPAPPAQELRPVYPRTMPAVGLDIRI